MALSPQERSRRMRLNMLMAMSYAVAGRTTFTPLSLFSAGEVGAWYDPSDFSTMFQDSAGTTPVTAVEQPVGLILDKSKGLVKSSELLPDPTLDNPSNWTASAVSLVVTGGEAVWTAAASAVNLQPAAGLTPVANRSYYVELTISSISGGALRVGNESGTALSPDFTTTGLKTFIFTAPSTSKIVLRSVGTTTASVSAYSIKELAGNHASQTTSTSRPVLSARVNLLTYTEQFDNAAWNNGTPNVPTVSSNSIVAPDGTTTGDTLTAATGGIASVSRQSITAAGAVEYTFSVHLKQGTSTQSRILVRDNTNGTNFIQATAITWAGGVPVIGGTTGTWATPVSAGNGWWIVSGRGTAGAGASVNLLVSVFPDNSAGTGSLGVWGADLRPTNQTTGLPPYQRVGAATAGSSSAAGTGDYDTTGFPYYLSFDGTDDFLVTGTINPGSVDKAQVFAGVRKLSDAALGALVETSSAPGGANPGWFTLSTPRTAGTGDYSFNANGTATATGATTGNSYAAPITNVLSGTADLGADNVNLRVNAVQQASSALDRGTGNFGSYPLYIGRRGGTSLPFNGRLYGLVVRYSAGNLPDADIVKTETWMNTKTGAY